MSSTRLTFWDDERCRARLLAVRRSAHSTEFVVQTCWAGRTAPSEGSARWETEHGIWSVTDSAPRLRISAGGVGTVQHWLSPEHGPASRLSFLPSPEGRAGRSTAVAVRTDVDPGELRSTQIAVTEGCVTETLVLGTRVEGLVSITLSWPAFGYRRHTVAVDVGAME